VAECGPGTPDGDQDFLRKITREIAVGFVARGETLRQRGMVAQDLFEAGVGVGHSGEDSPRLAPNISK
jgi:hypothetical protein